MIPSSFLYEKSGPGWGAISPLRVLQSGSCCGMDCLNYCSWIKLQGKKPPNPRWLISCSMALWGSHKIGTQTLVGPATCTALADASVTPATVPCAAVEQKTLFLTFLGKPCGTKSTHWEWESRKNRGTMALSGSKSKLLGGRSLPFL